MSRARNRAKGPRTADQGRGRDLAKEQAQKNQAAGRTRQKTDQTARAKTIKEHPHPADNKEAHVRRMDKIRAGLNQNKANRERGQGKEKG